ncbi:MAG: hypothetical protein R2682_05025 [Pyrinomonadaceae bacterium]
MESLISKLKRNVILQLFTISLRYLLGAAFVFASIFKIQGIRFTPESAANAPINSLEHFFETMYQTPYYWSFIGWAQLIVGALLMSQTFSTAGAVAFFPLIINIFVITISFNSPNILLITFLMMCGNVYLLLWDWNRLKFIALPDPKNYVDDTPMFSKHKIWTFLGIFWFFIVIFLRKVVLTNH